MSGVHDESGGGSRVGSLFGVLAFALASDLAVSLSLSFSTVLLAPIACTCAGDRVWSWSQGQGKVVVVEGWWRIVPFGPERVRVFHRQAAYLFCLEGPACE